MNTQSAPAVLQRDSDSEPAIHPEPVAPSDPRTVLLTIILVLMVFYTLYFTGEIVVPILFAILFKLMLTPGYRVLTRWHVPSPIAAIAMIVLLAGILGTFGYGLAVPASNWIAKVPESLPRIESELRVLRQPMDRLLSLTHKVEQIAEPGAKTSATPPPSPAAAPADGSSLAVYLFTGTRSVLAGIGIIAIMLFFLLAAGDLFMRKLVEILPTFSNKKSAVEMAREIEHNISIYLVTITIMNALNGAATGIAMRLLGLPNPVLWGFMAFLLNYVLILGPLTCFAIFVAVGFLTFATWWQALLPAAIYLIIHVTEGEFVTPMLVARRFTLNPVVVIGSLFFWDWMWGVPGALLAVPLLGVIKIVCDRVGPLTNVGHFIGG